jgi:hypothetical protein
MSLGLKFPPLPNLYCANAVDCHKSTGVLAYAAKKNLVFVWPGQGNASFPTVVVVKHKHGYSDRNITGS